MARTRIGGTWRFMMPTSRAGWVPMSTDFLRTSVQPPSLGSALSGVVDETGGVTCFAGFAALGIGRGFPGRILRFGLGRLDLGRRQGQQRRQDRQAAIRVRPSLKSVIVRHPQSHPRRAGDRRSGTAGRAAGSRQS